MVTVVSDRSSFLESARAVTESSHAPVRCRRIGAEVVHGSARGRAYEETQETARALVDAVDGTQAILASRRDRG